MNKHVYFITKNNDLLLYMINGILHFIWIFIFAILHGQEFRPMFWWNIGSSILYLLLTIFYNRLDKIFMFTAFTVELALYAVFTSLCTRMVCGTELYILELIPAVFLFTTKYKRPKYYFFGINLFLIIALAFVILLKLTWLPPEKLFAPERKLFFCVCQLFCVVVIQTLLIYVCFTTEIFMYHLRCHAKRLQSELEYTANHDVLTSLMNRRRTNAIFSICKNNKLVEGTDYALCIFDIDDFKKVNDIYGHDAGDFVLKSYSNAIWHSLPDTVKIARWGGEEFLIIYPERTEEIIYELEGIRTKLANTPFVYNGTSISVSATFGISSSRKLDTIEQVLTDADHRLLDGKQHGKNRIVVSDNY